MIFELDSRLNKTSYVKFGLWNARLICLGVSFFSLFSLLVSVFFVAENENKSGKTTSQSSFLLLSYSFYLLSLNSWTKGRWNKEWGQHDENRLVLCFRASIFIFFVLPISRSLYFGPNTGYSSSNLNQYTRLKLLYVIVGYLLR